MNKVRLLFAPENAGFADKVTAALAQSGYSPSTDDDPASAALVIWSQASTASKPILSAARSALARRVLVPVALGKTPPPPSFEHLWPMDLAGWNGRADDPRWRFVLDELELATRRGVMFRPAAANDRGEPAPKRPPKEPATPAPDRRAADEAAMTAPAPAATAPAAARPAQNEARARAAGFSRIAIGAGLMAAAMAGAGFTALMIGVSDGRRAGARTDVPVVALVAPPRSLENDQEEAAAPALATAASPAGTGLRDGTPPSPPDDPPPDDPPADDRTGMADGAAAGTAQPVLGEAPATAEAIATPPAAGLEPAGRGLYLRDCVDCPDLAEVVAGPARQTAEPVFASAGAIEIPQELPALAAPVAMAVRETTLDEWARCAASGFCRTIGGAGSARGGAPAVNVTAADAEAYAAWLSEKTGRRYRLPSAAEWAFAARGEGDAASGAGNAFGLFGLDGAVAEWTADCWWAEDRAADSGACAARVVMGAGREGAPAGAARPDLGFRVVRDLY